MRYYIITYGCQMNVSDSERIATILQKQGHEPTKKAEAADLIVINACSVRQSAMNRVYAKIHQYHKIKKIILAGCVLEADKNKYKDKIWQIWHPNKYFKCAKQKIDPRKSAAGPPKADRADQRKSAYLPIMTGCNNFCSYCVVPYTRGREKSRPAGETIEEVKSLIKNGCKEIMLLGQNVNSYNSTLQSSSPPRLLTPERSDGGQEMRGGAPKRQRGGDKNILKSTPPLRPPNFYKKFGGQAPSSSEEGWNVGFAQLLKLINAIPGNFTIKFLTSHPKDMSDELIDAIAKCKKVSKEIHLPIQSGDNTILKKMNRKYTVAHYKKLIKKICTKIPGAIISTDVIVGFPGETKKQFENTVKLFKEIKFAKAYVAMYSPRPGTAAYKLIDNVPHKEKKKRWRVLNNIGNK